MKIKKQMGSRLMASAISGALALGVTACGGGALPSPAAPPPATLSCQNPTSDTRAPLVTNPNTAITIKRDVHNFEVTGSAEDFAAAFQKVMTDPSRRFGLIKVIRMPRADGKSLGPFAECDRFQGQYQVDLAVEQNVPAWEKRLFGELAANDEIHKLLQDFEGKNTSDYGEIVVLKLTPNADHHYIMQYRYLTGSPIAGFSTFEVLQIADNTIRVTQTFEYQEQTLPFAAFFSAGGLKLHDQVVYSQVTQALSITGGKIIDTDVPKEYAAP
jgi:hypothetical protein